MNNVIDVLDEAIENRNIINFDYDGYRRVVEPHHYGISGQKRQLSAYQTEGDSQTGGLPEWRNFVIDKIENLSIVKDSSFDPRPDYNPEDPRYTSIQKSVSEGITPRPGR